MALSDPVTTVMSSKGEVTMPEEIRRGRRWRGGTRLVLEEREDGVLVREEEVTAFPRTRVEDVFGSLKYDGPPKTIEEMNAAVDAYFATRARD